MKLKFKNNILPILVVLVFILSIGTTINADTPTNSDDECISCKESGVTYGMTNIPPRSQEILDLIETDPIPLMSFDDIPSQFSWKNYGGDWTTPVKDQAYPVYCGSCYIFAVWGAFESAINIAAGSPDKDIILSEQYGLSCINSGCNGCGGGWGSTMLNNIVSTSPGQSGNGINGVPIESCMPYQAVDNIPCSSKCNDWDFHTEPILDPEDKLWQIANWGSFTISEDDPNGWNTLKTYLMGYGPIAVSMYWSNGMQNFVDTNHDPTDVYENDDYGSTNHLILCVGWVDDSSVNGGGYWILKNSHGTSQGYGGYCNLAYGCLNLGVGECDWVIAEEWPEEQQGPGPGDYDMQIFADFSISEVFPHPGDEIDFTDLSDGDAVLWEWDFNGDGTIDATSRNPSWTYYQQGVYEVTLHVWNAWGLKNTRTRNIEIKDNWEPVISGLPNYLVNDEMTFHFDARHCYDPDGDIVSYVWDFGDGTSSEEKYLDHTFPYPDQVYTVSLTLYDDESSAGTGQCEVMIDQTIPPETTIQHGIGADNKYWYSEKQTVTLSAMDWTEVLHTYYKVDEGSWEEYSSSDPYILVNSEGEHTIEAYSVDYYGNIETPVVDDFYIDRNEPTVDITLNGPKENDWFVNYMTVTINGNDDESGVEKIYYRYGNREWDEYEDSITIDDFQGIFPLYVTVFDNAGNQKETEIEVKIKNKNAPTIPAVNGDSSGRIGEQISLTIVSYDPNNEIYYLIDWDDGTVDGWDGPYGSGEEIDISHSYSVKGSYQVKIKAKNQYDVESDWGTQVITMPKAKIGFGFLYRFFETFPNLFPILQRLIVIA